MERTATTTTAATTTREDGVLKREECDPLPLPLSVSE